MSGGDFDLNALLEACLSSDSIVRMQAEQQVNQIKATQPGIYLSKLMETVNNPSTSLPVQQMAIVLLKKFLKESGYMLNPDMIESIAVFTKNAFESAGNLTSANLAAILYTIYCKTKTTAGSFGGGASAQSQSIEELMINLLTSAEQTSQIKGIKLAECFLNDDEGNAPEETKTRVASELSNILLSPHFDVARNAFEALATYGEFADGKETIAVFKKASEGIIKVISQAFAKDVSEGEELFLRFVDIYGVQKKAFRSSTENIMQAVLGWVKQLTPEAMSSAGLEFFGLLAGSIPPNKSQIFFDFGKSLLNLIKDALSETTFVVEDPENERFLAGIEDILTTCTEKYVSKNDKVLEKLEAMTKLLLQSPNWKDNVCGLILLSTIYKVSEDPSKDTRCIKAGMEWVGNPNIQIRTYAFYLVQAVMFSEASRVIKKFYKDILDKCFEAFESESKALKIAIAGILGSFFQQKEKLKIHEEDLEPYAEKACAICFENISTINKDSITYFTLLDEVFDANTKVIPEQAELLNSSMKNLLQFNHQIAPGLKLKSLSCLLKLFSIVGDEQLKKDLRSTLLANIEDLCSKPAEEFIVHNDGPECERCLSPEELSNSIVSLWKGYIQIYGKESLNDISHHWEKIKEYLTNPTKVKVEGGYNDNEFGDPNDLLNVDLPVDCVSSLKDFISEVIKCDSDRQFADEIQKLITTLVTKGYQYTCFDFDASYSLKEVCQQVYTWDHEKNPDRAVSFLSTVVTELSKAFSNLIHSEDPYNLTGVVIVVTDLIKFAKDLPKATLSQVLDYFPGRILEDCVIRIDEYADDEDEEEGEGTGKKGKGKKEEDDEDDEDEESKDEDEDEVDDDESFDIEDEAVGDKEYVWDLMLDICDLWGQLLERLQEDAFSLADYIVTRIILSWINKAHYKEKCVGYYSMFAILDHMEPQFIPNGFWATTQKLYENSTEDHQGVRHNCAFGLGLVAQKSPTIFNQAGDVILKRLFEMAEDKKRPTTGMKIYNKYIDNVYSAIGKALANNPQFMKDNYVEKWLKYLPLKYDDDESKIMFSEMCKMADNKECITGLVGKNGQFYDLVIKKFDESIESEFCDSETRNKLSMAKAKFISQKEQK